MIILHTVCVHTPIYQSPNDERIPVHTDCVWYTDEDLPIAIQLLNRVGTVQSVPNHLLVRYELRSVSDVGPSDPKDLEAVGCFCLDRGTPSRVLVGV